MTYRQPLRHDSTSLNLLGRALVLMMRRLLPDMAALGEGNSRHLETSLPQMVQQVEAQQALITRLLEHARVHSKAEDMVHLAAEAGFLAQQAEMCSTAMKEIMEETLQREDHSHEIENLCTVLTIYGYLLEQEGERLPALVDVVWLETVEKSILSVIRITNLRHAFQWATRQVGLFSPASRGEINTAANDTVAQTVSAF